MEVLPFITCHYVETMFVGEILAVLQVGIQREVILVFFFPAVAAIIVVGGGIGRDIRILLTRREIHTAVHMSVQVRQEMKLIVQFQITDQRFGDGAVVLFFQ